MDVGISIAIAGVTIPGAALLITVVKTRASKVHDDGNHERGICPVHSTFEALLAEMRADIKSILRKIGD